MDHNPHLPTVNDFRKPAAGRAVRWLWFLAALLAVVVLACNVPVTGQATIVPPPMPATPDAGGQTAATPPPVGAEPATAPALVPTDSAAATETTGVPTPALLPTFTPIAGPTLAATFTP